jgi:hypothetical protein
MPGEESRLAAGAPSSALVSGFTRCVRRGAHGAPWFPKREVLMQMQNPNPGQDPQQPPNEVPGQVPNPGVDPTPDRPVDPIPDQPIDPTIPPISDPVGDVDAPVPGPHGPTQYV